MDILTREAVDARILDLELLLASGGDVVVGAPAAQGDLLAVPDERPLPPGTELISGPVVLVAAGNGHVLDPEGPGVRWAAVTGDRHVIGLLDVPLGATAVLRQPRGVDPHTPLTLGAGRWAIRRQTEVTRQGVRHVAD